MSGLRKFIILQALLLGLLACVSCSRLPEYSLPRIEIGVVSPQSHVVFFRNLAVADFRATSLPDDLVKHKQNLNAHTSVALRTRPGAKYILPSPDARNRNLVCGHIENLAFEVVMLPEKSWWSPTLTKDKEAYVLQHEQIHFALMEVAARQLNRRISREHYEMTACEVDADGVTARISATIDRWMAESQKEALRQHRDFDEDTSRLYAPKVQQQWYDRIMRELQALAEQQ